MRKLILQEFVSVDMCAADEHGQFTFMEQATPELVDNSEKSLENYQVEMLKSIDTMIIGRNTYDMFKGYWPDVSPEKERIAQSLNSLKKYVVSSGLDTAPWGKWEAAEVIGKEVIAQIQQLKEQEGKDIIVWGSIKLAHTLMDAGLIDIYILVVCPVILGKGKKLFKEIDEMHLLNLKESLPIGRSSVLMNFEKRTVK